MIDGLQAWDEDCAGTVLQHRGCYLFPRLHSFENQTGQIFSAYGEGVGAGLYHISRNFTEGSIPVSHRVEDGTRMSIGFEASTAQQHARWA